MSIDIGRYINYLLFKQGAISLDGIGTISLVRDSAQLSHDKLEIFPPKTRYEFTEVIENQSRLIRAIEENEELESDVANHYVTKYCEDILNKLLNYNIVKVADIGFLEKNEGKTVFIPSEKTLNKSYFGLPSLRLKKIEPKTAVAAVQDIGISEAFTEAHKEKYGWLNYLGALILGGIMVMAYHYFLDPLPNMPSYKNSKSEIGVIETTKDEPDVSTETNVAPGGKQKGDILTSDSSSLEGSGESEDIEDTASVKIAQPKDDTECIIIVGVYNRTITALQMSDRLREDGYIPYRDDHFDTQRVGIRFKCGNHDLKEVINTLRRKYNRNAWYLVPQVSI